MIRSHIGSTQEYVVVFKLEKLSHLLGRSFRLGLKPYQFQCTGFVWFLRGIFMFDLTPRSHGFMMIE